MDLTPLITPSSIAIVGASAREGSIGHELLEMIKASGYDGNLYPVNPRYSDIAGQTCYKSIEIIGKPIDLAMFVISALRLEQQVDIALQAGVRSMVITPNAVFEGDTQPLLAERIKRKINDAGIPVSGHNSMGFYNNDFNLRACGFRAPKISVRGPIAFISQSGSVFSAITHNDPQLKFNLSINTGTELNVTVADYILYALKQPTTKVIGMFIEAVRDPERFEQALQQAAESRIPVVVLKVGKSELGAKYTISHSGGLAGNDDAFNAVLRHYGAIRVHSMDELANTLMLFSHFPEVPAGDIAMIADSGGERSMLADEAASLGLNFASLSSQTMAELADLQEFGQEASNPLDPWGTGNNFEHILRESLAVMTGDKNSAIGILSLDIRDDNFMVASCISALRHTRETVDKPVVHMTNYTGVRRQKTTEVLNSFGVPVLCGTRPTLRAVRNWLHFRDFSIQPQVRQCTSSVIFKSDEPVLQENDALQLLKSFGLPTVDCIPVQSEDDVFRLIENLEFPVVLKTIQSGLVHKSDRNGVVLNITDEHSLIAEYRSMAERIGETALVQPMMTVDYELILGMKTDEIFGPVVIVGTGGIFAEQMNDRFVILPTAGTREIHERLQKLSAYRLLKGVRGKQATDMNALVDTIERFCRMIQTYGNTLREVDINPLAISQSRPIALDALIVRSDDCYHQTNS